MTEQQKAEAYVREQRPALMEKVKAGVTDMYINSINLNDWLGVLWESNPNLEYTDAQMPLAKFGARAWYGLEKAPSDWIWFDAITGQPATEADYKAFNEIVSV